jgi:hypothetical protein
VVDLVRRTAAALFDRLFRLGGHSDWQLRDDGVRPAIVASGSTAGAHRSDLVALNLPVAADGYTADVRQQWVPAKSGYS